MTGLKDRLLSTALRSDVGYRLYLRRKTGRWRPKGEPKASRINAVLKTRQESEGASEQVKGLGLPPHADAPKNWDSLAALDCILRWTSKDARILDSGAELYSVILPWLYLYGYHYLNGIGFAFTRPVKRGPILYEYGDITRTRFRSRTFDAITCLSVIEHGVELHAYFREMSRILKDGGLLITSTDYWPQPIDTRGQWAYGVPIRVFTRDDILGALEIASKYGLGLEGDLDLEGREKVVKWDEYDLEYTFIVFALRKL